MTTPNVNTWCPPIHHVPTGPTDPTLTTLPTPFIVLITGASRGIGRGIALSFAKAGCSGLLLTARDSTALTATAAAARAAATHASIDIQTLACDLTDSAAAARLADFARTHFGRLDVLVLNAGRGTALVRDAATGRRDWPADLVSASLADFGAVMEMNVGASVTMLHCVLPLLEETRDGPQSVVQLSSAAAHYVDPRVMAIAYSLSKSAVTRLVEHAHEAHKGKGVSVFALQPGGVKSEGLEVPEGKGWEDSKFCPYSWYLFSLWD
jgi:NAD(P)-dependent dehydrogenase (short-subunit alcohol dehydrogenase family)